VAVICCGRTFVEVVAAAPVSLKAIITVAGKAARSILTKGIGVAVAQPRDTFVHVVAGQAVAYVALIADALESSNLVVALGIYVAVMGIRCAFIDVHAYPADVPVTIRARA